MLLSGYFFAKGAERNIDAFEKTSLSKYMRGIWSQLVRLLVPYLLAFAVEMIGIALYRVVFHVSMLPNDMSVLQLFLLGGRGPGSYYIPVMVQFCFLAPVLHRLIRRYPVKGLVISFTINLAMEILKTVINMDSELWRVLIFRYIFVIAAGMFYQTCKKKIPLPYFISASVIGAVYLTLTMYFGIVPNVFIEWTDTNLIAVFWILTPMYFLIRNESDIKSKVLHGISKIGRASWDVFLVQMVYYYLCESIIARHVPIFAVRLVVNVVICVFVGLLFYRVEQPITSKCKKLFKC